MTPLERAAQAVREADGAYLIERSGGWMKEGGVVGDKRMTPDWDSHPVDVLKWCVEQMGRELDPEAEAKLRDICDEMVPLEPGL